MKLRKRKIGELEQHQYWEKQIELKYRQIFLQTLTILLVLIGIAINIWLAR